VGTTVPERRSASAMDGRQLQSATHKRPQNREEKQRNFMKTSGGEWSGR
jgi:hypothetical protein